MSELSVMCWGFESRLDEAGGWGFSIHPDKETAELWAQNRNIQRTVIEAEMNALCAPYVCGRGVIRNPSSELVTQLAGKSGIFVQKLEEKSFYLISGSTPDQVTESFLDEMNNEPD